MVDVATGTVVGSCGATLHDAKSGVAEVGYYCALEWRGKGLTHRAVKLLSRWCVDTIGWERLELFVEKENESSRKVAARAGYEFEGIMKRKVFHRDAQRDVAVFAMVRTITPSTD